MQEKVNTKDAFQWQSMLKCYWKEDRHEMMEVVRWLMLHSYYIIRFKICSSHAFVLTQVILPVSKLSWFESHVLQSLGLAPYANRSFGSGSCRFYRPGHWWCNDGDCRCQVAIWLCSLEQLAIQNATEPAGKSCAYNSIESRLGCLSWDVHACFILKKLGPEVKWKTWLFAGAVLTQTKQEIHKPSNNFALFWHGHLNLQKMSDFQAQHIYLILFPTDPQLFPRGVPGQRPPLGGDPLDGSNLRHGHAGWRFETWNWEENQPQTGEHVKNKIKQLETVEVAEVDGLLQFVMICWVVEVGESLNMSESRWLDVIRLWLTSSWFLYCLAVAKVVHSEWACFNKQRGWFFCSLFGLFFSISNCLAW